jgi:RND family efflux transporter MFP subunit
MHFVQRRTVLAILLTAVGCRPPAAGPQAVELPPMDLPVAAPVSREVTDYEEYPGRVMATERVQVMARADGYLAEIRFRPGQIVKKGDVLFVIDPRPYKAALDVAKGQLAQAEARVARLTKDFARMEKLMATGAGTWEDHDKVVGDLAEAKAAVASGTASVEQAKLNLDFTEVRAPIAGRVGREMVTVGNLVQGMNPTGPTVLTDIVAVDKVYVYFDAPERDVLRYRRMMTTNGEPVPKERRLEVDVGLYDEVDYPHRAVVDFIPERVEAATGTQAFRAVLDNPKGNLFTEGMFARVRVAFSKPFPGLAVADRVVLAAQGNKSVYVVNDQNVVEERPVELGRLVAPGLRHVKAGLKPTDRVVVANLQKTMPGAKVKPVPAEMPLPAK